MFRGKRNSNWIIFVLIQKILCILSQEKIKATDVASNLNNLLKPEPLNDATQRRFKELDEKITKISNYAIDRTDFAELILNETKDIKFNQTTSFKNLKDEHVIERRTSNPFKSLYRSILENMNRDDIEDILLRRNNRYKQMFESARRSGGNVAEINPKRRKMDDFVSSVLTNLMVPDQNYFGKLKEDYRRSNYWDPTAELDELMEYHKHENRRLFKASTGEIKTFPFMVSIHVMGRFWCGGVLYWNDLVLTSCSCLQLLYNNRMFRENPRVLSVRIASNHSLVGGEVIDAQEIYFHPAYNPKTLAMNIAAIRLQRHVYFSDKFLPKIIPISKDPNPPPSNAEVIILGWGATKKYAALKYEPTFLQKQVLPIYPNYFCKQVYGDKFILNSMFCAGTITTGEGACDHDAGGPAIFAGRLVGIISFGPAVCGYPNSPTVFTNVGFLSGWIESIRTNMPGYYQQTTMTTTLSTTIKETTTQPTEETTTVVSIIEKQEEPAEEEEEPPAE